MKIMVRANTFDEHCSGPNVAVLELTKEQIDEILSKCEAAQLLEEKDSTFYKLEYFDYTPDWLENYDLPDDIAERIEGDETVVITEELNAEPVCVDCSALNIKPNKVFWSGYIKHTNIRVETAMISVETLKELKEAA